jgi:hypothetical protein
VTSVRPLATLGSRFHLDESYRFVILIHGVKRLAARGSVESFNEGRVS